MLRWCALLQMLCRTSFMCISLCFVGPWFQWKLNPWRSRLPLILILLFRSAHLTTQCAAVRILLPYLNTAVCSFAFRYPEFTQLVY